MLSPIHKLHSSPGQSVSMHVAFVLSMSCYTLQSSYYPNRVSSWHIAHSKSSPGLSKGCSWFNEVSYISIAPAKMIDHNGSLFMVRLCRKGKKFCLANPWSVFRIADLQVELVWVSLEISGFFALYFSMLCLRLTDNVWVCVVTGILCTITWQHQCFT